MRKEKAMHFVVVLDAPKLLLLLLEAAKGETFSAYGSAG
jgi:hypothetical protein